MTLQMTPSDKKAIMDRIQDMINAFNNGDFRNFRTNANTIKIICERYGFQDVANEAERIIKFVVIEKQKEPRELDNTQLANKVGLLSESIKQKILT